jgi:hypothetical protein
MINLCILFYQVKHKSSKLGVLLRVVCIIVRMTTLIRSELFFVGRDDNSRESKTCSPEVAII